MKMEVTKMSTKEYGFNIILEDGAETEQFENGNATIIIYKKNGELKYYIDWD